MQVTQLFKNGKLEEVEVLFNSGKALYLCEVEDENLCIYTKPIPTDGGGEWNRLKISNDDNFVISNQRDIYLEITGEGVDKPQE